MVMPLAPSTLHCAFFGRAEVRMDVQRGRGSQLRRNRPLKAVQWFSRHFQGRHWLAWPLLAATILCRGPGNVRHTALSLSGACISTRADDRFPP